MGWKEPGLGWKLFAGLSIALFVGGLFVDGPKPTVLPWLDEVTLPIEVLVLLGLVSYAFNLRIGAPRAWRYLAAFYAAWGALLVIVASSERETSSQKVPRRCPGQQPAFY
ncbi:MAG TPA: hypothetical protein VE989_02740 [Sphingomicrobium sp.]|nr:hypothetical protein [Sphingomicrobium sp.]